VSLRGERRRLVTALSLVLGLAPAGPAPTTRGAENEPPTAAAPLTVEVPGRDWAFTLAPRRIEFGEPQRTAGGRIWVDGDGIDEPRLTVTVLIDERPGARSAAECRAATLVSRLHLDHEAELSTMGGMAIAGYDVESYRGEPVRQRRLHGFLYRDGICVDVGLSMLDYQAAVDRPLLEAVLRSAGWREGSPAPR
jgi:hypothetical protein